MAEDTPNDNDIGRAASPQQVSDANGQAAILLVESLIHGLIGRSIISPADAVEIVDIAAAVNREIADEYSEVPNALRKSLSALAAISASLKPDIEKG